MPPQEVLARIGVIPEMPQGIIRDRLIRQRRHFWRSRINANAFSGMTGGHCGLAMRVRTCRGWD